MPKAVEKSREEMIDFICEDMEAWMKRDSSGFWSHVQELERDYLKEKDDAELKNIYEESI